MEITNFLSSEALLTFTMSLVMVELWVSVSKGWVLIDKLPTKFYTLLLSVVHLFIINIEVGLFTMTPIGIYTLLCNALIITILLNGGYDFAVGKITIKKDENK